MRRPSYHKVLRPSPKVEKYLGGLEAAVMEHLWTAGEGTVREVAAALGRPLAYTTVMTVLSRLVEKGLLVRQLVGRSYRYRPAVSRAAFLGAISRRIVDELVADFGDLAVAQFLDVLARLEPERLAALRRLAETDGGENGARR